MKKQMLTVALALSVILTGINYANADVKNKPSLEHPKQTQKVKMTKEEIKMKMEERIEKFNEELGLTELQIEETKKIKQNANQKIKPLAEKKKAKYEEIKQIRNNDDINIKTQDKKVEALMSEIKLIDQDIRQVKQDERKQFKSILTQEQKTKLEQMKNFPKKHNKIDRHRKEHIQYTKHN